MLAPIAIRETTKALGLRSLSGDSFRSNNSNSSNNDDKRQRRRGRFSLSRPLFDDTLIKAAFDFKYRTTVASYLIILHQRIFAQSVLS